MTFYHVCDLNIKVDFYGEYPKPVILFIHGFGTYPDAYKDNLFRLLTKRYFIIAPNLIGHGLSNGVRGVFSVDQQMEMIEQLLCQLKINNFYLMGDSFGGLISFFLGKKLCQTYSINRVILLSPFFYPGCATPLMTGIPLNQNLESITPYIDSLLQKIPSFFILNIPIDATKVDNNPSMSNYEYLTDGIFCKTTPTYSILNPAKYQYYASKVTSYPLPISIIHCPEDLIAMYSNTCQIASNIGLCKIVRCRTKWKRALMKAIRENIFIELSHGWHQFYEPYY